MYSYHTLIPLKYYTLYITLMHLTSVSSMNQYPYMNEVEIMYLINIKILTINTVLNNKIQKIYSYIDLIREKLTTHTYSKMSFK